MENQNPTQQQPQKQQDCVQQPQQGYAPQPQQGYYQQPQPNYAAQPAYTPKPDSHLGLAIFVTLCCCLPLGIVAIIKANKVDEYYNMKQFDAAILASNDAKKWCMYGFIGYFVWLVIVGIIYAIAGAAAFSFIPGFSGLG